MNRSTFSFIIIIIIKMQDLEWHIIMSIIAGALYIVNKVVYILK